MKISVFGMGYVGTVSGACLAARGHEIVCVDTNREKLRLIDKGQSPIVEDGVQALLDTAVNQSLLKATDDADFAILNSDISVVCVGTPSRENGDLDLSYIERVCIQIGKAIKTKGRWHDVVIRSTMLPGSTDAIVIPALSKGSGLAIGEDFGLCVNPEFLREGTAVYDYNNPPKTVIGRVNESTAEIVRSLFSDLPGPVLVVDYKVAETVKYVDNVWHALKVGFANEIGRISRANTLDSRAVMDVFKQDVKLNISDKYLSPGFAFGGSCLPKDVRALSYHARTLDVSIPIISSIMSSNEAQIAHGISLIRGTGNKKVGIIGFAFKAGTDDLRESPIVEIIEHLLGKGFDLRIYDDSVNLAFLLGANREHLMERIPHIADLMVDDYRRVFTHGDTIVIGNPAREIKSMETELWRGKAVVDLVDALGDEAKSVTGSYSAPGWL